jgi:hypothetical protein
VPFISAFPLLFPFSWWKIHLTYLSFDFSQLCWWEHPWWWRPGVCLLQGWSHRPDLPVLCAHGQKELGVPLFSCVGCYLCSSYFCSCQCGGVSYVDQLRPCTWCRVWCCHSWGRGRNECVQAWSIGPASELEEETAQRVCVWSTVC